MPDWIESLSRLTLANVPLWILLAKATAILLIALGITWAMGRASAGARHLVWLVTLGVLLAAPVLSFWAPLPVRLLPAPASAAGTSDPSVLVADGPAQSAPSVAHNAAANFGGAERAVELDASSPEQGTGDGPWWRGVTRVVPAFVALWAAVAVLLLLSLAWATRGVSRIVRHARPLHSADWQTPLMDVADRIGLEALPRLLQSDEAMMPFACGIRQPTIVLPASANAWSVDRRYAVLLHELAHVRRRDLVGHTLARLTCALYWFHPLIWTAAHRLRSESERACDDVALSSGTRAADYAEHLLDIVTSVKQDATPSIALAMARRNEFEGRMLAILDPELPHVAPSRRSTALIGALAVLAIAITVVAPVARDAQAAQPTVAKAEQAASGGVGDSVRRVAARRDSAVVLSSDSSRLGTANPSPTVSNDDGLARGDGQLAVERIDTRTSTRTSTETSTGVSTSAAASAAARASSATSTRTWPPLAWNAQRVESPAHPEPTPLPSAAPRPSPFAGSDASTDGSASDRMGRVLAAARTGGRIGKDDDRPVLLAKVLRTDADESLRRIAAWGLEQYPSSAEGNEALTRAISRDASASVREMAAWAMGERHSSTEAARAALMGAVKNDASEKVRATAAWAMGTIESDAVLDALVEALTDGNADVRKSAAWAIGSIQPKAAPRGLLALLRDKNEQVRELSAWALFQIEDATAISALETALKVELNKDVQVALIRALASMGEKSVDALRGLLESSDSRVKQMAVRSLAGGNAAGPWPWPWPQPRPFP